MIDRNIKDEFSNKIDECFQGIDDLNSIDSEEYEKVLEITKALANKDFSKDSNRKEVFDKTLKNINEYRGEDEMKKGKKIKHPIAKVASFLLIGVLSVSAMQTSFAQDIIDKIVKIISLKNIEAVQIEPEKKSYLIPENLKGKIFDKDGNMLEVFQEEGIGTRKIYTADGQEIANIDEESGEIITVADKELLRKEEYLVIKDADELNSYTCFNVILPSYLPDGYKFDRAEFYKDEDGIAENSKYIDLYFVNQNTGKNIYMQQSLSDEETAFGIATDGKIEEVKVNNEKAILMNERSIYWEYNDVLYSLMGRGEIGREELVKIAGSIK
ncbi:DUF4367 domain-containing protein [Tissierella sp. MB52-C2]|uniref:DUF4367 domain-containing protein n=1 Tax=Tissierella sp. MB52-C2 TaxID=3070999 RepID=UPI00280B62FE|nr:DUF4367 domain-containing protein [Tissierella sp. MB52-C2]WMM23875.1 DUF4367 domain-containing protein [Tissierella sp. MB52-C2]